MKRGNVLVVGNSGVGKSTLINAVLGAEIAETGHSPEGTTKTLKAYESDIIPFRMIDTMGFEPSLIAELKAINAVKKWSRESAKAGNEDNQINVIWFCVDGTSRKLFPKAINSLSRATAMWPTVPVIVVITKSYSVPEREENIQMVREAFEEQKRFAKNLRAIIPVVASTYRLNDTAYAAPEGIAELIETTNDLMPEGVKAAATDIAAFNLSRKRFLSHGLVAAATAAGVVVGAVPIPFADAAILSPVEVAMVNTLAKIYGIDKNEGSKRFFNSIVEVGTVSVAARAVISALKAIPGLNLGASVLNAVIAGSIIAALGEGSIYAFEQVYQGHRSIEETEWVGKLMESVLSQQFVGKVQSAAEKLDDNSDNDSIVKVILDLFKGDGKKSE